MTRTLYDSTTVGDIPAKATMVAGYVDGRYRTVDALHERFPKATVVTITVLGQPGAHVCDTEPGNIGPAAAARWAKNEVSAGRHPTLYVMASQWDEVKRAVAANGVTGKVSYWIADYDGDPKIPAGAVAKQYLHGDKSHPGSYSGGHYDVSVIAGYWPGVDPKPTPKPKATNVSRLSLILARRLTSRLSKRHNPVAGGRNVLAALDEQIQRVLKLK